MTGLVSGEEFVVSKSDRPIVARGEMLHGKQILGTDAPFIGFVGDPKLWIYDADSENFFFRQTVLDLPVCPGCGRHMMGFSVHEGNVRLCPDCSILVGLRMEVAEIITPERSIRGRLGLSSEYGWYIFSEGIMISFRVEDAQGFRVDTYDNIILIDGGYAIKEF